MSFDIDAELSYLEKRQIEYDKFLKERAFKLELNKTYLQEADSWSRQHYKIIFVDETIAVGLKVYCGIYGSSTRNCGTYELFKVNTGEKYNDTRLCYRLKEEVDV